MKKARKLTKPARKGPVIDIHAHWFPPEWVELIEAEGNQNGARVERTEKGLSLNLLRGINMITNQHVDMDIRLKAMRRQGVDMHALSLCAPMLPMQAPELALLELERASALPGMRGAYMATSVNGKNLDEEAFFPVYAKCEQLRWPIFLHPTDTLAPERISKYHLRNLLGIPYEHGVAAASLMFGGTFPWLIGRWDHGTKVRAELKHMKRLPSRYLRRFTYDTITHSPQLLSYLVDLVGADRIMLGSDYCFDMGYEQPVRFLDRVPGLSAQDRGLILGGTAARLLKI